MPAATTAKTTTAMSATTAAPAGENGRGDRQRRSNCRCDDACEKPVVHLSILLVAAMVSPLQRLR
jgi:hypothetical protein